MAQLFGSQECSWHVTCASLIRMTRDLLNPCFEISVQNFVDLKGVITVINYPVYK